jgi:excinuclease ABC subunit A
LLDVLSSLVDKGNSVLVIEHNLDVIKTADWIVDLGPDGGIRGGTLVAEGTPEEVARNASSYTGQFLKEILAGRAAKPSAKISSAGRTRTPAAKKVTAKKATAKTATAKKVAANKAPAKRTTATRRKTAS